MKLKICKKWSGICFFKYFLFIFLFALFFNMNLCFADAEDNCQKINFEKLTKNSCLFSNVLGSSEKFYCSLNKSYSTNVEKLALVPSGITGVCEVSFQINDSALPSRQQVVIRGMKLKIPSTPLKLNAIFVGWYTDESLTKKYDFGSIVNNDFTLYAKFEKVFTVSFETNGGTSISDKKVTEGNVLEISDVPTKRDAVFSGWYTDRNLINVYATNRLVSDNFTLYAKWIDNQFLVVTFETNDETSISSLEVARGSKLIAPVVPARENKNFVGWYADEDFAVRYNFENIVNESFTLYAKWIDKEIFTVSFETNGGNVISSQQVMEGKKLIVPTIPVKKDKNFVGWYADEKLTNEYVFDNLVGGNFTLYAKWKNMWVNPFEDVEETDWFYEDIEYMCKRGFINGSSEKNFGVKELVSRALVITVLGRVNNINQNEYQESVFEDILPDDYCVSYANWAYENKIVLGVGNNKFMPNISVKRENFATILYRYLQFLNKSFSHDVDMEFIDEDEISDYAKDAVKVLSEAGIIEGREGKMFDPKSNIAKFELAAIFRRFIEKVSLE
jgi:uncharacterized repeat protein (TIGR02543 family)